MSPTFLEAFGAFLSHLLVAILLTAGFVAAYVRATPHDEIALIRVGNTAAALALSGAMIGYAIVISRTITFSGGLLESAIWGLIGLAIQLAGHFGLRLILPNLAREIESGSLAAGVASGALAITLGLLNAASMTP